MNRTFSIFTVVESIILMMSVGLMTWTTNLVILHGNKLARFESQVDNYGLRIDKLEVTQGYFQALTVEIRGLREGQQRIERALEEHQRATVGNGNNKQSNERKLAN